MGLTFNQQISMNSMVHKLCVKRKRVIIYILHSLYGHGQLSYSIFLKIFDCKNSPQSLFRKI